MNAAVLTVIILNAFFLAISIDNAQQEDLWIVIDVVFSAFFIVELVLHCLLHGGDLNKPWINTRLSIRFEGPSRWLRQ